MRENALQCLVYAAGGGSSEVMIALLGERGFAVTECAKPGECFDLLARRRWRFWIVDVSDTPGSLGVLSQARETCSGIPSLALVRRGDVETAVGAMKAGAADCIETPIRSACLFASIAPFCEPSARASKELLVRLTRVEQTVLGHILDGRTNRQIADMLCRSPRTIEVHRRHVMGKLNADNLIDLVKQAMRAGLLDGSEGPPGGPCDGV